MRRWLCAIAIFAARTAYAYLVGPAVPLVELAKRADIVCKATVTADAAIADPWFDPVPGFEAHATRLDTVSCLKGSAPKTFELRHYAHAPKPVGMSYTPQFYDLTVGTTYVVFAAAASPGVYRQLAKSHTMKVDQGVLRTADAKPMTGATVTDALRAELAKLLASTTDDVVYGIHQLDEMSGGGLSKLADFDRTSVLAELRPLVGSKDDAIATAAIGVFGGDSPYFSDDDAPYWLAGIGKGEIPGLTPRKLPKLPAGDLGRVELLAVANGRGPSRIRGLAIRALARSRPTPAEVLRWYGDADPDVRRAAVLAMAELADHALIVKASADSAPGVRRAAALAAGFAQDAALLPELEHLLDDADGKVSAAAAMAILSFGDAAKATMTKKLATRWGSLFVSALARKDPKPYLAKLGEVIEKQLQPDDWWGGFVPAGDAWQILFEYVKAQPAASLPALAGSLDSLERMTWYSSSQPRDLYALYVRRGLAARAKAFRAAMKTSISYSMDPYLDEADKHPETYVP